MPPTFDQPTNTDLPGSASPGPGPSSDRPGSDRDDPRSASLAEEGAGNLPPALPVPLWPPPPPTQPPPAMQPPPATPGSHPGSHWAPPTNGIPPAGAYGNGFKARPRRTPRTAAPLDALGRPVASWFKRALAFLVDFLLLSLLLNWFGHVVFSNLLSSSKAVYSAVPESQALSFLGISFLVWMGYLTLLGSSRRGQTIGMMLYGIAVRGLDGGPVSVGRAAIRSLILVVASGFLVDAFWPLWDPRRQALHDKPARTLVIDMRLAALMQQLPPDRR